MAGSVSMVRAGGGGASSGIKVISGRDSQTEP